MLIWLLFYLLFCHKLLFNFLLGNNDLIFKATLLFLFFIVSHVVVRLLVLKSKACLVMFKNKNFLPFRCKS